MTGQTRAREELATFYDKVLPQDFVAARRMTYTRLPELAKKANVRYEAGSFEIDPVVEERAGRAAAHEDGAARATTRASGASCSTSRRRRTS